LRRRLRLSMKLFLIVLACAAASGVMAQSRSPSPLPQDPERSPTPTYKYDPNIKPSDSPRPGQPSNSPRPAQSGTPTPTYKFDGTYPGQDEADVPLPPVKEPQHQPQRGYAGQETADTGDAPDEDAGAATSGMGSAALIAIVVMGVLLIIQERRLNNVLNLVLRNNQQGPQPVMRVGRVRRAVRRASAALGLGQVPMEALPIQHQNPMRTVPEAMEA